MIRPLLLLALLCITGALSAQAVTNSARFACADEGRAVQVHPLHSDSLCSSFLICVNTEVPLHLHRVHTEHAMVLEGEGRMTLGDSTFTVHAGDVLVIPRNTPHAVVRQGPVPLKVVSVQAPHFDGSDRVPLTPSIR